MSDSRVFALEDSNFTIVEAARHLCMGRTALYELIGNKQLRVVKRGRRTVVPGAEIKRYQEKERASGGTCGL
jgi:excisionase family DNA binding protein